ncbi:TPA: glycosyltransferase family 9 protein [Candidatus Woesearchaeota archaeon]|nr:hypothetical protein [uncultured archaeon]MBS3172844.1 glycosyltransferase family 9 protein [Candidatus Woesearchaeota archaeon]HIH32384.1 glycosyltransferase family 9 protein [Candidatus Woesearchaeota archaeon]HIH54517.1 glycosyltransferase family 9 protein [Candidatus Woesearchaeota archaeon]HIJ02261.1 glycosyltransferase family 9 protein [Candidatus Woesearchaeota archaeon]
MFNLTKFADKHILDSILFLWQRRRNQLPKKINSIMFIKLWALGDSVNTLPLISETKKRYPKTKITVLASKNNMQVYRNQLFIDELIGLSGINKILWKKFDVVFDLEPYLNISAIIARHTGDLTIGFSDQKRSRLYDLSGKFHQDKHIVITYMDLAKHINVLNIPKELIKLRSGKESEEKIKILFDELKIKNNAKIIGFCAGAGKNVKEREWPKEKFKALAIRLLGDKNNIIILTGSKEEYELNEFIRNNNPRIYNFSGKVDLESLFCLIKKFKIFISNDTGPMHIAAAQGVKTIGLFGPNTPKIWAPYGKNNISIFHQQKGCPFLDNTLHELVPRHLTQTQKSCMDAITVNEVMRHI